MTNATRKEALGAAAAAVILPELAKSGLHKSKKTAGAVLGVVGAGLAVWLLPENASAAAFNAALLIGSIPGDLLVLSETLLDFRAMGRDKRPAPEGGATP